MVQNGEWFVAFLSRLASLADDRPIGPDDAARMLQDFYFYHQKVLLDRNYDYSDLMNKFGVPESLHRAPQHWTGWQAGHFKQLIQHSAGLSDEVAASVLDLAIEGYRTEMAEWCQEVQWYRDAMSAAQAQRKLEETSIGSVAMMSEEVGLDKVHRAEAHLDRTLRVKLQILKDQQSARKNKVIPFETVPVDCR